MSNKTGSPYNHTHYPDSQLLTVPFKVPSRAPGSVTFTVEPDTDPARHGLPLIAPERQIDVFKGFPLVQATTSSPHSPTYASLYGWVQVTNIPGETEWEMDKYPMFLDDASPFMFWGSEPSLVDAPNRDPFSVTDYDWRARSYLTYTPDVALTKVVVPIMAFEWGFWIKDSQPYVKELKQIELGTWNEHLELFRSKYSAWEFSKV